MKVEGKDYQEHSVFKQLDEFIEFYDDWSMQVMSFLTMGTKGVINIDTYVYSSISGTLDSINLTLQNGRINDAYALLRKYHDSAILDVYINLYLEDNHSLENFIVEKVQNWVQGTDQLPNFRGMTNYIKDNVKVKHLYQLLNHDDRYDKIRDRCNNNTHYNFYRNVMLNDNKIYNKDRLKYLEQFSYDLGQLLLLHFSYIFFLCPHYMASSDYADHLECGMPPPDGCQNWVANNIQDVFTNLIEHERPDIGTYIKSTSPMDLS